VLFAYSTLLGWSYYGETGIVYLLGAKAAMPYRLAWLVFVYLGATGSLHLIWDIADTLNGLMAIPNLIGLLASIPAAAAAATGVFQSKSLFEFDALKLSGKTRAVSRSKSSPLSNTCRPASSQMENDRAPNATISS
jgi:hypothetical protein